jgi:hypothetical protein
MTLDSKLWSVLRENRSCHKVLMDTAIKTIKEFYSEAYNCELIPGCIVVLHPFGRDVMYKPHIHIIATKGGFNSSGNFVEWKKYIPFKKLHKKWMYNICNALKKHLPNTFENQDLFRIVLLLNRDTGFVVDVSKPDLKGYKGIAKYIARYVRHPAIADSRIVRYDGEGVLFYYISHKTKKKEYVLMDTEQFMLSILQHVPEKHFKMIRYYGAYSRNQKKKYKKYHKSSIRQKKLSDFGKKDVKCPKCGKVMEFVEYFPPKKPPPYEVTLKIWM